MHRIHRAAFAVPLVAIAACGSDEPLASTSEQVVAAYTVRTVWPSPGDPGAPFYARIEPEPPHIYHDGTWGFVLFYRDPACVRGDFNLLQFFDPPAAFGCAAVVSGASIWPGAAGVGAPRNTRVSGNAVPVWFFPADALLGAIADGELTIGELETIAGRIPGIASHMSETLHPHALPPELGGGGHPNPILVLAAKGMVEDGRAFSVHLERSDRGIRSIRISIR